MAITFKKSLMSLALSSVLVTGMTGCTDEWTNWFNTETVKPEVLYQPANAADIVVAVKAAKDNDMRLRMVGNGLSMSDITVTQDVLMTPEKLNEPLELDRTQLNANAEADEGLVRIMSGMGIRKLNDYLDSIDRAVINLGGYDGQTFAGVANTATHGSGLAYGPMADQIASMQMVVADGKVVQIEPTNGITDPAKFKGYLTEDPSIAIELIQDDKVFNAAKVAMGSMGVVYSYVLNTDQKFWLREVRKVTTWSELKKAGGPLENLMAGKPVYGDEPSPEHFELQYSPFVNDEGDYTFLVTERWRSYEPLEEQEAAKDRGQPGTDFVSGLVTVIEKPAAAIFDLFPELSRGLMQTSLTTQEDDNFTNKSYKVFNIGVINLTPVRAIEASFDIQQTIDAVEHSFKVAEDLIQEGTPHTSPVAIRFVKSSDSSLAMQQGRNTSFMEVISFKDGKNTLEQLRQYQSEMIGKFDSRPHWGLDLNSLRNEAEIKNLYPKWDEWKSVYTQFNDGTFDGKFTDRVGISIKPR